MGFKFTDVSFEQLGYANQFVIKHSQGLTFQSYKSIIANIDKNGVLTLTNAWDYSRTTLRYLYLFITKYQKNDTFEKLFNYNNFESINNKRDYIQKLINEKKIKVVKGKKDE